MFLGEFERAWQESDDIAARGAPDCHRLWDGTPFDSKRVIIRCLHGYGDAIQFLRYAPCVKSRAREVIVETHPEMVALVSRCQGVDRVVTWGDGSQDGKFRDWDRQIEVMELPRAFRTTLGTIPSPIPYFSVTRRSSVPRGSRRNVGILWESSQWNPLRSIPFPEMCRLLQVPGISFYSFQRGTAKADLAAAPVPVIDTSETSPDILDTAADLLEMDLLITVDTMAAHLAGALGRPVWTLLHWDADWRWMLDRSDSPWYPSMRIFRQPSPGDWTSVIDRVLAELS